MNASQNQKKALSFGLAVIPILAMLLLLIIGYGIMGLRIEPLLLCSAAVAAGMAGGKGIAGKTSLIRWWINSPKQCRLS